MPCLRPSCIAVFVLAFIAPASQVPAADEAASELPGPAAALGGPGGPVVAALVKHYDRNGDGQLEPAERQAATDDMLRRFDRNHNGKLDPDELTAALVDLGARRPEAKQLAGLSLERRLLERFDEDHDGQLNTAERRQLSKQISRISSDRPTNRLRTEMLRRLDVDSNGRLDPRELEQLIGPAKDEQPAESTDTTPVDSTAPGTSP